MVFHEGADCLEVFLVGGKPRQVDLEEGVEPVGGGVDVAVNEAGGDELAIEVDDLSLVSYESIDARIVAHVHDLVARDSDG